MFCPECRAEYREGFDRCADCDIDLVAELPEEDHSAEEYTLVFETTEPDVIPVIKSLLESEDIPYATDGEAMSNLFPGIMGAFYDSSHAQVHFAVPTRYAERVHELLEAEPNVPYPAEPEESE